MTALPKRSAAGCGRWIAAVLVLALASACGSDPRPDIVLVTLDTTRVDRLGCYGYRGETTPHLDRFARDAVVYTRAYSTSSWTFPAHASLFTGKFTSSHGARYDPEGSLLLTDVVEGPERWRQFRVRGLAAGERTLAAILREAGYATAAVVAGPWLKRVMGLADGFDDYDDDGITSINGRPAPHVTDRALSWLEARSRRPFFLFLNYFDPHEPLRAPAEFLRERPAPGGGREDRRSSLYDAEIRFMDHHLGRFFEGLHALDLYDDSWIIVTADHGELLGEHGMIGHGNSLHEELVRIPLLVKPPGSVGAGARDDSPAQLVDVFATVVARLGLPLPPDAQGSPLGTVRHPIVAEAYPLEFMRRAAAGSEEGWRGATRSLHRDGYKFVWSSLGRHQLFDLAADPRESRNLVAERADVADSMRRDLTGYLEGLPRPSAQGDPRRVDPETEEALRNLGYLE